MFDFIKTVGNLFTRNARKEEYIRFLEVEYHIPRSQAEDLARFHRLDEVVSQLASHR